MTSRCVIMSLPAVCDDTKFPANGEVRSKLYTSVILPKLEYCSSVWDPHQAKYISELESVQKLACRTITKSWSSDYQTLLTSLQWPTLQSRRKQQKPILCHKLLNNCSSLPASLFTPHPSPSPRFPHNKPFIHSLCYNCIL